jgi:hypothetical protein
MSKDDAKNVILNIYLNKPYVIILVVIVILSVIIFVFFSIRLVLYLITLLIFLGGLVYLYVAVLKPKKNKSSSKSTVTNDEEVFYIANNIFSYDMAPKACAAYNSRLATYDDMITAYKSGANWCSYGWTMDQNVFFPTQQATLDKLSKIKGHEHACGHIGLNGGYVEDKSKLFGVNCFGVKPKPTEDEVTLMDNISKTYSPQDSTNVDTEKKLDSEKNNWILFPFNNSKWTKYIRV